MRELTNPFFTGTNIPDRYFCDREKETADIIKTIENGTNLVLTAYRRIGKSSLLNHVLAQKRIRDNWNTFYIDVLGTNCAGEFLNEFRKSVLGSGISGKEKIKEYFVSIPDRIAINAIDGIVGLRDYESRISVETIFSLLEKTGKPNLVVFDEFQQIKYYDEPMTAILRSYIQRMNNSRFIFSGSSRRMLSTMFTASNEPFYNSAATMNLEPISLDVYTGYCQDMFSLGGKRIHPEAVKLAYHLTGGSTYTLQNIMKETYNIIPEGKEADRKEVTEAIRRLMEREDNSYRNNLAGIASANERKTLIAVALEGVGTEMVSSAIGKKYNLGAPSSVSYALKNLSNEDRSNFIIKVGNSYILQDRIFELWLADRFGLFEYKLSCAEATYNKELEAQGFINLPKIGNQGVGGK